MPELKVLYDGWPLAAAPESPAAVHLLEILENLPEGIQPLLALPDAPPDDLPTGLEILVAHSPLTPTGRQRWVQRVLARLKQEAGAAILHTTQNAGPLLSGGPLVASPSGFGREERQPEGLRARLGAALAAGGLSRAAAVLWPNDQTPPAHLGATRQTPSATLRAYHPPQNGGRTPFDLPPDYILAQVPATPTVLNQVLSAWSWAAGPIGEEAPLVLLGLDAYGRAYAETILESEGLQNSVRLLPAARPADAAAVYRGCTALFHPAAPGSWGSPVRRALACGKPVVSSNRPDVAELVGPAGFLIEENDARHLGGGVIAVIVKDAVRKELQEKATARSAAWEPAAFTAALAHVYSSVIG